MLVSFAMSESSVALKVMVAMKLVENRSVILDKLSSVRSGLGFIESVGDGLSNVSGQQAAADHVLTSEYRSIQL